MSLVNRRRMLRTLGVTAASIAVPPLALTGRIGMAAETASESKLSDSKPMQLYKSLSDQQRKKVCLPVDHPRRQFVSNWWYIHKDSRIPGTFNGEQQQLIQEIFDSMHSPEHQAAVNKQVEVDQYGALKNAPAVGFFGTPDDQNFEFIYTGHHVTRRCNAHTDSGQGFGGAPIFYGHFPDEFNETKDHPGNPYWYQGKVFNEFVQSLDGEQQQLGLVSENPRSEKSDVVIRMNKDGGPGLACSELASDGQQLLLETMGKMMAMFRQDDVTATLDSIKNRNLIDQLHVSWYEGKYDVGSDKVWDTWQIEGPEMVWYFRGFPHIHSYFHLKS